MHWAAVYLKALTYSWGATTCNRIVRQPKCKQRKNGTLSIDTTVDKFAMADNIRSYETGILPKIEKKTEESLSHTPHFRTIMNSYTKNTKNAEHCRLSAEKGDNGHDALRAGEMNRIDEKKYTLAK